MAFYEIFNFFTIVVFIDLLIALHILMNKHEEPASALLWLLVVVTFPILGMVLYLFFGINRIKTLGTKIAQANQLARSQQKQYSQQKFEEPKEYNKTLDRLLPENIPVAGNKLSLLHGGTTAYPKMLSAITKATKHIHLQSFIIHNDAIGKEILDALVKKAKEGVKVKVLYDKFGSLKGVFSLFFLKYVKLKRNNRNFQINSFALTNLFSPWRIQLRNHRKVLIVDGKIAFVGGINISSDNDIRKCNKDKYIHDLHCIIEGPAIYQLQSSFLRDWHYASKRKTTATTQKKYFPPLAEQGESVVRIIDSGPGQNYAATQKLFFTAAATAKHSLWIMTPYFIPDKAYIQALSMAAARGVEVKVVVPKKNNHWYAQFASRSMYRNLLLNGVKIFEKIGLFSHAKAIIVDDEWAVMGSSNCDTRSFYLNYELDFIVSHGDFINSIQQQFLEEFSQSEEIQLQTVLNKKLPLQLLENICSLLTPIL